MQASHLHGRRRSHETPAQLPAASSRDVPMCRPFPAQTIPSESRGCPGPGPEHGLPRTAQSLAGGGGKGMRVVTRDAEFAAWRDAASEALNAR